MGAPRREMRATRQLARRGWAVVSAGLSCAYEISLLSGDERALFGDGNERPKAATKAFVIR
jgi:hypothetical protein